jgi:predicted AlkP superfamily phosphohydrolase/phosphomutase
MSQERQANVLWAPALLVLCLAVSCGPGVRSNPAATPAASPYPTFTPGPTPTEAETPTVSVRPSATVFVPVPSPTPTPVRGSVFVIGWDGGRADLVYGWMAEGHLPHFSALAAQGLRAEYARSIDPPLTAPAQNSIASGSYPAHTGVVSNAYHNPTDSFYWYRRGFDEPLDKAEPVWVTASRAGFKTAALFFASGTPLLPGQTADYTVGYGVWDAYSKQLNVALDAVKTAWAGTPPLSFSPPREGSFTIQEVSRVYVYLFDSSDDGQVNYDTLLLNTERKADENARPLKLKQWTPVVLLPATQAGADFLLQDIQAKQVKLFYSGVYHSAAAPRSFLEALNAKFGFFPAGSDSYAIDHEWITVDENFYLMERQARWMAEVTAWVYSQYHPDLLFTWQDCFDAAGHLFWMSDERQADYSPANQDRYHEYFLHSAEIADQALGVMLSPLDLRTTTVMMVADHGMAPVHTRVYVNTVLEQAGLLVLDERNYVDLTQTKALAVASGGAVNIDINLRGHEKSGIVPAEDYLQVQDQVVAALVNVVDPQNGQPVFQRVLRQEDLKQLHLDHLNSGDVFAQAYPGYDLDDWRGIDDTFRPVLFYGQHGYDSSLPEMQGIFIASGAGVPVGGVIPPVSILDYAPTIAFLMGFKPAATVDGLMIPALTSIR